MVVGAVLLPGCSDRASVLGPAEATPVFAATQPRDGPATAAAAIDDVITRVLPALEPAGTIEPLRRLLLQLATRLEQGRDAPGLARALTDVQNAVVRFQAIAGDEFQPDIDVLHLALHAAGARR